MSLLEQSIQPGLVLTYANHSDGSQYTTSFAQPVLVKGHAVIPQVNGDRSTTVFVAVDGDWELGYGMGSADGSNVWLNDNPVQEWPATFTVGESWRSPVGDDWRKQLNLSPGSYYIEQVVEAKESITVPAGTFPDAYRSQGHFRRDSSEAGNQAPDEVHRMGTTWYVPGIGTVAYDDDKHNRTVELVKIEHRTPEAAPGFEPGKEVQAHTPPSARDRLDKLVRDYIQSHRNANAQCVSSLAAPDGSLTPELTVAPGDDVGLLVICQGLMPQEVDGGAVAAGGLLFHYTKGWGAFGDNSFDVWSATFRPDKVGDTAVTPMYVGPGQEAKPLSVGPQLVIHVRK